MLQCTLRIHCSVELKGTTLASEAKVRNRTLRAIETRERASTVALQRALRSRTSARRGGPKKAQQSRRRPAMTKRTLFHWSRAFIAGPALGLLTSAAFGQPEVMGQVTPTGAPVP